MSLPVMTQGPGHFIQDPSEEQTKDDIGFTNPNLHRRIDPLDPEDPFLPVPSPLDPNAILPNSYEIGIYGKNSYMTQTVHVHDEYSTTSEIP